MNKENLLKKAEAALEKNLDILAEQPQPYEVELAIKAVPVIVDVIYNLSAYAGDEKNGLESQFNEAVQESYQNPDALRPWQQVAKRD